MIDHITFHVKPDVLPLTTLLEFWEDLGFTEVRPDDPFEHGYEVRWFMPNPKYHGLAKPMVHCVSLGLGAQMHRVGFAALGHICVVLPGLLFDEVRQGPFCTRDSGSGRIWAEHGTAIRVECRRKDPINDPLPSPGFTGTNEQRHPFMAGHDPQPIGRTFPPEDEA